MKSLLLSPLVLFSFSFSGFAHTSAKTFSAIENDSTIIEHKLDGKTEEWPADKFTSDKETEVQYAIDNDATNLFLVLNISNLRTQFKMMRSGMSLYIDMKGKKKESHGVDFPVKNGEADLTMPQRPNRQSGGQPTDGEQKKPDIKMIRKMLALNMVQLKVFGLSDEYPDGQQLLLPGSVNIAFSFDSADVMHIEYLIPLSLLGDKTSLDQQDVSIGWKIHAFERPKPAEGSTEEPSQGGGYGGGQRGGYGGGQRGGYGGGGNRYGSAEQSMMQDQKFWTKYTFHIPAEKKAF